MRQRIAIVGGGVAGLTAGHLLCEAHDVTLFESRTRLGGNAYTYRTRAGQDVDIGVAAFGKAGYPVFYALLDRLGVRTKPCGSSYLSFHDLDTGAGIYLTPTLRGLAAQRFRVLRPDVLRSLVRLLRGVDRGRRIAAAGGFEGMTLCEGLARVPELTGDARVMFLGTLCLLSSMSGPEVLASPARFFFDKLAVHHDVISPRAAWSVRTVEGFTRGYVEALAAPLGERVVLGARIRTILREDGRTTLVLTDGRCATFDKVVLACNADRALALLDAPTPLETRLLGSWKYKEGRMVVHDDHSSFPPRPLQQAFTFLYTSRGPAFETSVNGVVRHLPGVPESCDLIGSQYPNFPIDPARVELETVLRTPIFDVDSCRTIPELPSLNGIRGTYHCGSHFGYGLHEDAVRSAVEVASALGARFPT